MAVADLVSFQELLDASQVVSIGDVLVARTPQDAHALLLACLHRAAHHHDSDDLLWLYDIHLLAERLTEKDVASLLDLSQRSGAGAVCARGLRLALDRFETRLPATLFPSLEAAPAAGPALPAAFLKSGVRKADLLMADLGVLHGADACACCGSISSHPPTVQNDPARRAVLSAGPLSLADPARRPRVVPAAVMPAPDPVQ